MSRDLNRVMIIGRLGQDPLMKFTPNGSPVTTFSVAAGRQWKSADGTPGEDTEWFNVVAWNKLAEICNEHLKRGTRCYIEGRLQTRSWDDATTGDKRYKTEVIASDMIILSDKAASAPAAPAADADELGFDAPPKDRGPARSPRPAMPGRVVPMDDADLPF